MPQPSRLPSRPARGSVDDAPLTPPGPPPRRSTSRSPRRPRFAVVGDGDWTGQRPDPTGRHVIIDVRCVELLRQLSARQVRNLLIGSLTRHAYGVVGHIASSTMQLDDANLLLRWQLDGLRRCRGRDAELLFDDGMETRPGDIVYRR